MDTKRFTEINGHEALNKLIQDENIFNVAGQKYYIKNSKLVRDYAEIEALDSGLTIEEILGGAWYIKKPFDVRAEMLARPDEWVGAYKSNSGTWYLVGFNLNEMTAVEKKIFNTAQEVVLDGRNVTAVNYASQLDRCIPIEDVPKEELI